MKIWRRCGFYRKSGNNRIYQDDTSIYDNQKDVLGDESNVGLFRKYVLTAKGKESSESMKRRLSFSAMDPRQITHTSRPSTLLEKHLLPALESNGKLPVSSGENKMSKPQLTIFYGGAINVYDNVSVDQAQAIFRLASGATVSPSAITNTPKVNILKTQKDHQPSNSKKDFPPTFPGKTPRKDHEQVSIPYTLQQYYPTR